METERKKLIRPITIIKVKAFMNAVLKAVAKQEPFSLDALAREHQISGSNGTALLRNGWLKETDVKFMYVFDKPFSVNDSNAKLLIEQVRLGSMKQKPPFPSGGIQQASGGAEQENGEPVIDYAKIRAGKSDLTGLLAKAFASVGNQNQMNIFEGANHIKQQRFELAKAIATGVYGNYSHRGTHETKNDFIILATADLMDKLSKL